MPILTLSDVNRYAKDKKKDGGGGSSLASPVPSLPTPGEGGFVSFRDNLKALEARRVEEAKRAAASGIGGSVASGAGKKGYGIKAGAAAQADSFLRDDGPVFLGGLRK